MARNPERSVAHSQREIILKPAPENTKYSKKYITIRHLK